ncbi:hypothetical protein ACKU5V_027430 [Klebsiella pneumoniae]
MTEVTISPSNPLRWSVQTHWRPTVMVGYAVSCYASDKSAAPRRIRLDSSQCRPAIC